MLAVGLTTCRTEALTKTRTAHEKTLLSDLVTEKLQLKVVQGLETIRVAVQAAREIRIT